MTVETQKNVFERVFEEKIEEKSSTLENPYIKKMILKMCDNCVICQEKLNDNTPISSCENPAKNLCYSKPCGSLFHSNCLNTHFKNDNRCPICRFAHFRPRSPKVRSPRNSSIRPRPTPRPRGHQNPFIAFCCKMRYKIKDENPNLETSELLDKMVEMWRVLSLEDKQIYVIKAREHNMQLCTQLNRD
jgi:hypothetical protein